MKKLRIGVFSLTCDEGCSMQILEILNKKYKEWLKKIDIVHFRLIKTHKKIEEVDVAFVEGAVSTEKDLDFLMTIRKTSKKVIAIGSCAISGFPSNRRNFFDKATMKKIKKFLEKFGHRKKVEPIKNFIKVDAEISGCPMVEENFIELVEKYLNEFGVKDA